MAEGKGTPTPKQGAEARQSETWTLRVVYGKTIWEWMQLLIVPVAITLLTIGFALWQDIRQHQIETQRAQDLEDYEAQRGEDLTLQSYFDTMSTLVLKDHDDPHVKAAMQARTLTTLIMLDTNEKLGVLTFLYEANLFGTFPLHNAALQDVDLSGWNLQGIDLSDATLDGADLRDANLQGADLSHASLLNADLRDSNLSGANLINAHGLRYAQVGSVASLRGATMPNGQKYEDWLKSREGEGE